MNQYQEDFTVGHSCQDRHYLLNSTCLNCYSWEQGRDIRDQILAMISRQPDAQCCSDEPFIREIWIRIYTLESKSSPNWFIYPRMWRQIVSLKTLRNSVSMRTIEDRSASLSVIFLRLIICLQTSGWLNGLDSSL